MDATTARKEPILADRTEHEQFEEYECEDHYKEPKPEELSLLGDQVSQSLRHLSVGNKNIIVMYMWVLRNKLLGSKSAKSSSRRPHQTSIQIATNETERIKFSSEIVSRNPSTCHSACGPNPSKITLICLLVSSQKISTEKYMVFSPL